MILTTMVRLRWATALAGALAVSAGAPLFAQATGSSTSPTHVAELEKWSLSLGIDGRAPTGEFEQHVPEGGGGVKAIADRRFGRGVFSFGGEASWLLYDEEKSAYSGEQFGRTLKSATTDHTSINYSLLLRVGRPRGKWRPYVDAVVGGHTYRTTTTVDGSGYEACTYVGGCHTYDELSSTQLSDTTLTYGGGAGFMRTISKGGLVLFDMSIRYLRGGETEYLTNGAIRRDGNTIVQMDVTRSRTDAVAVYLGIGFSRPVF
jgi:hypothetical protein